MTDPTEPTATDEAAPPVVQLTDHTSNEPAYVDPVHVTHIRPSAANGVKGGTDIGTTGGIIVTVLEDVLSVAKLFGWL